MAFFRIGQPEATPFLRGDGVYLRPAEMTDFDQWAAVREASRSFLVPWEPTWPADDLTRAAFRRRLRRHSEEMQRDESYSFLIFRYLDDALLGGLTVGQVRRGVAQSATLGYWMAAAHAGKGYMSRGVRAAMAFAFDELSLHRVEAACLPTNEPSMHLLAAVGFQKEGYARGYLRINGRWQDHVLFALIESQVRKRP